MVQATQRRVTPQQKHRSYWARHPLPVILVLHHEAEGKTIWADARAQIRAGAESISVDLDSTFDAAGVRVALARMAHYRSSVEPQAT